jgi:hypothetical protein
MFDAQSASQSDYKEVLAQLVQRLTDAGLQVMCSFDKQIANPDCANTLCPYHVKSTCEHHLVVLLVYGAGRPPVTLLSQGCNWLTRFSLANTPQQPVDPELEATITAALAQVYSRQSLPLG